MLSCSIGLAGAQSDTGNQTCDLRDGELLGPGTGSRVFLTGLAAAMVSTGAQNGQSKHLSPWPLSLPTDLAHRTELSAASLSLVELKLASRQPLTEARASAPALLLLFSPPGRSLLLLQICPSLSVPFLFPLKPPDHSAPVSSRSAPVSCNTPTCMIRTRATESAPNPAGPKPPTDRGENKEEIKEPYFVITAVLSFLTGVNKP
ncbi:hypothetical protein EYF80_010835 [Liparis tanakae]|uniref:Uncharacterized protein n=1 Tax=Liparis tanakae TaxID=230148 RepID=A0A4Z2ILJ8_9TELE|nr:hypothetical protein EYF80_010835 [Liparis tanakae]